MCCTGFRNSMTSSRSFIPQAMIPASHLTCWTKNAVGAYRRLTMAREYAHNVLNCRTMEFINPSKTFPFSDAVIYSGRILETVITGIPDGSHDPVPGGVRAETI